MRTDKRRAKLQRVALEAIDRQRNHYADAEQQEQLLGRLIQRHNLRDPKESMEGGMLTTARYRQELRELMTTQKKVPKRKFGDPQYIDQLFMEGSSVIHTNHLADIEHDDGGTSDSEDGEEYSLEAESAVSESAPEPKTGKNKRPASREISESNILVKHPGGDFEQRQSKAVAKQAASISTSGNVGDDIFPVPKHDTSVRAASKTHGKRSHAPDGGTEPWAETPSQKTSHVPTTRAENAILNHGSAPGTSSKVVSRVISSPFKPMDSNGDVSISMSTSHIPIPETAERAAKKLKTGPIDLNEPDAAPAAILTASASKHHLIKLSNDEVKRSIATIWSAVQEFAHQTLSNEEKGKRPKLFANPEESLRLLYETAFSRDWEVKASQLLRLKCITPAEIVGSCVAAGVFVKVFQKPFPWRTPAETMALLSQQSRYVDIVLKQGAGFPDLEFVIWQAGRIEVLDEDFQKKFIEPEAMKLAGTLALEISPQLDLLIMNRHRPDAEAFWSSRQVDLTGILKLSLILRGQLAAAPDYYQVEWIPNGARFECESMNEIHQGEGPQMVNWCVSPRVLGRASKESAWQLVSKAKVFTRPMPEL